MQSPIGMEGNKAATSKETIFLLGPSFKVLTVSTNWREFLHTYLLVSM